MKNLLNKCVIILFCISCFTLIFSSCKNNQNNNQSSEKSATTFSDTKTTDSTSTDATTKKGDSDKTTVKPTAETTTSKPRSDRFTIASEMYTYNNGKQTKYSSNNAKSVAVVSSLNDSLASDNLGALKMLATKELIDSFRENGKCVELKYEKTQKIHLDKLTGVSKDIKFDTVIFVYDGDYSDTMFFINNDDCSASPVKLYNSDKKEIMLIEKMEDSLF